MRSLIIGMGIGNLYKSVLTELGAEIHTVDADPAKQADYTDLASALSKKYDTVHICTPNFTHEVIARQVAPNAKIVFIEKPGVITEGAWMRLVDDFPKTRFMMVKNNQWRTNIQELRDLANASERIELHWINDNRVPSPGTWFTTKELAFGGVSRDLMTHLLSLVQALDNQENSFPYVTNKFAEQRHQLSDVLDTEYGLVKADGVYNVDDYCEFTLTSPGKKWHLIADWRGLAGDDRGINFHLTNGTVERFELGLCPEDAYLNMIDDAVRHVNDDTWWYQQYLKDCWIHRKVDGL